MLAKLTSLRSASKRCLLIGLLTTIAATECGCASLGPADASCRVFKPIAWSKSDTLATKREVVRHNAKFDAVCPGGPANG